MVRSASSLGRSVVVLGWGLWIAGWVSGTGSAFAHDRLIQEGGAGPAALALSLVGWQVMIAAMMVPSSLPHLRALDEAGAPSAARGPVFLAGYFATWSAFGALAFAGDALVHAVVDGSSFLTANPWLVSLGLVSVAVGFEVSALRRGHVVRPPAVPEPPAGWGWFGAGAIHGLDRVRRCWGVMVLSFAFGMESLVWMVLLTSMMLLDRPRERSTNPREALAWTSSR